MKNISDFINKLLHRKAKDQRSKKVVRKYYCPYCSHSWETDDEYPTCPICAQRFVVPKD